MLITTSAEIIIYRRHAEVALFAADPGNAPDWCDGIERVEWRTRWPLRIGSQITYTYERWGRKYMRTYDITIVVPGEKLGMYTSDGFFPMEVIYTWEKANTAATRMVIRKRGTLRGFRKIFRPLIVWSVGQTSRRSLERLKALLEKRSLLGGFR